MVAYGGFVVFLHISKPQKGSKQMAIHNELGHWGERKAAEFLENLGLIVRDRDWKFGHRDLDIVATTEDATTLVVAEVKTRAKGASTDPLQAVGARKMRNVAIAANAYVKEHALDAEIRFDIVTVIGTDEAHCRIEHLPNAFNPLLLLK